MRAKAHESRFILTITWRSEKSSLEIVRAQPRSTLTFFSQRTDFSLLSYHFCRTRCRHVSILLYSYNRKIRSLLVAIEHLRVARTLSSGSNVFFLHPLHSLFIFISIKSDLRFKDLLSDLQIIKHTHLGLIYRRYYSTFLRVRRSTRFIGRASIILGQSNGFPQWLRGVYWTISGALKERFWNVFTIVDLAARYTYMQICRKPVAIYGISGLSLFKKYSNNKGMSVSTIILFCFFFFYFFPAHKTTYFSIFPRNRRIRKLEKCIPRSCLVRDNIPVLQTTREILFIKRLVNRATRVL